MEIRKKVLGENHPDYANSLNNLASLYQAQGDYPRAEPLFRQALEIQKKVLGENHPDYAGSLNNLACCTRPKATIRGPNRFSARHWRSKRKSWARTTPHYAASLNNLASLYRAQGDYSRAEPLYRQALEIRKRESWARTTPIMRKPEQSGRTCIGPKATIRGPNRSSARHWRSIRKSWARTIPDYALSLNNLANLYQEQGDFLHAEPLFRQAVTMIRRHIEATAVIQSERQQLAMLQDNRHYLDNYLKLAVDSGQCSEPAYRELLAWKGMVLRRNRLARAATQSPELAATFTRLQRLATQLAPSGLGRPRSPSGGELALHGWKAFCREGATRGRTLGPQCGIPPGKAGHSAGGSAGGIIEGFRAGRFCCVLAL